MDEEFVSGASGAHGVACKRFRALLGLANPSDEGFTAHARHDFNLTGKFRNSDTKLETTMDREFHWRLPYRPEFQWEKDGLPYTGKAAQEWRWQYATVLENHSLIAINFSIAISGISCVLGIMADVNFATTLEHAGEEKLRRLFLLFLLLSLLAWVFTGLWQTQCDKLMKGKYIHGEQLAWYSRIWLKIQLLFLYCIGAPLIMLDVGGKTVWQRKVEAPIQGQPDNFVIALGYKNEAGAMADNTRGTRTKLLKFIFGDVWMISISVHFQLSHGACLAAMFSCVLKVLSALFTFAKMIVWCSYDIKARKSALRVEDRCCDWRRTILPL